MTMYGIAIIGCGDMGTQHAAAWNERDDARVIAVCDTLPERANKLAQLYDATQFQRWHEAIQHADVDVVSICVPACDHHSVAIAAANAGKHILCEKAMALTLSDADEMIAAADANQVFLSVCHQYRSLSRFQLMKQLINDGCVGNTLYIRFAEMREVRPKLAMHRLGMNGGPIHDMSGHLFDLGRYLTGCEAESVSAVGTVLGKNKPRLKSISDFGIDTAAIQVRFREGHCLSIDINWGLPEGTPGYCQELIHGPNGMLYSEDCSHPDRFLGDISHSTNVIVKDSSGTTQIRCDIGTKGPQPCIGELVTSIDTGKPSQYSAREGRAALQLVLASLESVNTGLSMPIC